MKSRFLPIVFAALLVVSGCAGRGAYRKEKAEKPGVPARPAVTRVIVLDPGHGGDMKGAVGPTGLKEKDVVLDIAGRLERLLRQKGYYEVYLTRKSDVDVSLVERRELAARRRADLFISIHCDGNKSRNANGTTVYILSDKGAGAVKERALTEGDYLLTRYNNGGAGSGYLKETVVDLIQDDTRRESRLLAELTVNALCRGLGTRNWGVKGANFAVLKNVDVPSMLVEAAFITNWYEEKILKDPAVRQKIAQSLCDSVDEYFRYFYR